MFHQGFANEFAKAMTDDRVGRAGRRLPAGESARLQAKRNAERSIRSFDAWLSAVGAIALLALVLTGVVGALVVAAVTLLAAAWRSRPRPTAGSPAGEPEDRWWSWRIAEPDNEYLRRGAA